MVNPLRNFDLKLPVYFKEIIYMKLFLRIPMNWREVALASLTINILCIHSILKDRVRNCIGINIEGLQVNIIESVTS